MACAWDFQFRVLLLGDSGVGKTSLLHRYTDGQFTDTTTETVGVDFCCREEEPEPGVKVRLQFWDTAGQERYRAVTRSYYRNAAGVLLLFDLSTRQSFDNVTEWHKEVTERTQAKPMVFMLLGAKNDLKQKRTVSQEEAQRLAENLGAPYLETSARTGSNVSAALSLLCRELLRAARSQTQASADDCGGAYCTNEEMQTKQEAKCTC
ncbi:ras-related protein Rab-39B [Xenopus laevis]|uniref:Ras-related protein Rab-39B n=2 Tax=Xenopus laevis TaxID=8355 RepID=A0A1L8HE83_XENLA|nr:ras-related protein Rab-39B [Xenopus laevis]OCT94407.1 hypothetical protein XELAEV_18012079mg [Xenopus laevis]